MSTAGKVAWGLVVVVGILHFDFWLWDDDTLVLGFVPMALAYHAGISVAAALSWWLVVIFDWPQTIEEWASGDPNAEPPGGSGPGERAASEASTGGGR